MILAHSHLTGAAIYDTDICSKSLGLRLGTLDMSRDDCEHELGEGEYRGMLSLAVWMITHEAAEKLQKKYGGTYGAKKS
jgi:hypothetical protein